jgi:hypothetical protein
VARPRLIYLGTFGSRTSASSIRRCMSRLRGLAVACVGVAGLFIQRVKRERARVVGSGTIVPITAVILCITWNVS